MRNFHNFVRGSHYSRAGDIHAVYGGQRQSGIVTPKNAPYIFLFTSETGSSHGYEDGWSEDGVFMYTGEGQEGDMAFQRGNKAIRDHAELGRELLLFAALGKGRPVRFEGEFSCASWEIREGDGKGNPRKTIVFHLLPNESAIGISAIKEPQQAYTAHVPFDEQRRRAYAAAKPQRGVDVQYSLQAYRKRSDEIKGYVLARSSGICEACGQPAPFRGTDDRPYLEAHHTHRLADGGLDDPRHVAAICANCHRRCHFGQDALQWNHALIEKIRLKETELG